METSDLIFVEAAGRIRVEKERLDGAGKSVEDVDHIVSGLSKCILPVLELGFRKLVCTRVFFPSNNWFPKHRCRAL